MLQRWSIPAILALLALTLWDSLYGLGGAPLRDAGPNEAQYAEVAREMVESGDWVSPELNYAPFLTRPPLTYWLIGAADTAFGAHEFSARLPSALAGLLTVLLLLRLGTQLMDTGGGLLAGGIGLATVGFLLDTHKAGPHLILTAAILACIFALVRLLETPPAERRWLLIGLQISIAAALLTAGPLGVVLPALIFGILLMTERRLDLAGALLHPRAWWFLLLLGVPWYFVVSLRHPGFFSDYFFSQHTLLFFDHTQPVSSALASLLSFWTSIGVRLFPWTVLLPLAVSVAVNRIRQGRDSRTDHLALTWMAAGLLLYSVFPAHREQCGILLLPPFALLLAALFRDYARPSVSMLTTVTSLHVFVLGVVALLTPWIISLVRGGDAWFLSRGEIAAVHPWMFGCIGVGALVGAGAALGGHRGWTVPALVASLAVAVPLSHRQSVRAARFGSSIAMAAAVNAMAESEEPLVFEAPQEYQRCAGLNFYLRRKLTLLRPAGAASPTYLAPYAAELFITREELEQLWQEGEVFLITNPAVFRARLDRNVVPQPFYIIARDNGWWAVSSRPLH